MYYLVKIKEKVRVPPKEFGEKLDATVLKILQQEYEGLIDEDLGLVVAVLSIDNVGKGKVVPGDGAAYFETDLEMLVFKPLMHELVEGFVSEVTEFGAFVRFSPIDGLVHVSQIIDDYITYDAKLPGFVGKKTKVKLTSNDNVFARIVTISLKGNIQNSKIGLTMRQPFLGKEEWQRVSEKTAKERTIKIKDKNEGKIRMPKETRDKK
ncbi:MAG: DNA-directed RNA polymerase [Candidatus ainarchaeum sp.]|nr:DNA-directed RNA polymerase [Candidatus ainarchaeum sp.]